MQNRHSSSSSSHAATSIWIPKEIGMEQPEDEVVIMEVEEEGGGVKGKGKGKAKGKVPSPYVRRARINNHRGEYKEQD
ncbi:hypothetical protein Tsubulata_047444 [Turnera subulata]|uniref:Uncharacterized protein n=1 Tax=Turnera subulata TaxID=218843 RepID=A0A9Q0J1P9_9ROSI|nr:hypothetical protein Tsubulata_047444 [Turnera subulata]